MKTPRIILPVLLIVTGFTCWFGWITIPQTASQTRIKIEDDQSDVASITPKSGHISYDPYFVHVNCFGQILMPASKPK